MTDTDRDPNERDDWRAHAACRGAGSLMFDAEDGGEALALARMTCFGGEGTAPCPVRLRCSAMSLAAPSPFGSHARTVPEPAGVWCGTLPEERAGLRIATRRRPPSPSRPSLRGARVGAKGAPPSWLETLPTT